MDRSYYGIIDAATEAVRLSTAIVRNADYKHEIKDATDIRIMDISKAAQTYLRLLNEVLRCQEQANLKSIQE